MICKKDLITLYEWARHTEFKLKIEPTSIGHPTKPILYCMIKLTKHIPVIRKKYIEDASVLNIISNPDILFCGYVSLQPKTEHGPHKDLNVYIEEYKRIQIPIKVPSQTDCYMIWNGNKITWNEGEPQVYEVMDYVHEGYNYSDEPLEFLFLDVRKTCSLDI